MYVAISFTLKAAECICLSVTFLSYILRKYWRIFFFSTPQEEVALVYLLQHKFAWCPLFSQSPSWDCIPAQLHPSHIFILISFKILLIYHLWLSLYIEMLLSCVPNETLRKSFLARCILCLLSMTEIWKVVVTYCILWRSGVLGEVWSIYTAMKWKLIRIQYFEHKGSPSLSK